MLASTRLLRNILTAIVALGFDPELVLRGASLGWQDLADSDGDERRLPVEAVARLWAAAVAVTGDPNIGVRIGALAQLDHFGVLGSVARASATLGDALLKTGRYMRLWIETARLCLLVEGDQGQLIFRSLRRIPPVVGDAVLTQLVVLSRELTGRDLVPSRVRMAHPPPTDDSVYRDVFRIAPTFRDVEYSLVFSVDVLTLPIATHDPGGVELLSDRATRLVDALAPGATFARRVRDVLAAELHGGNPMMENVAARLGVHPKTVNRRLKQEGTSHRELLDCLRRELAEHYLAMPGIAVTEVAFLLGFSDASAFNKALRRWFGIAPLDYRRRLLRQTEP